MGLNAQLTGQYSLVAAKVGPEMDMRSVEELQQFVDIKYPILNRVG